MREEIQRIRYDTDELKTLAERGMDIIAELRRLIEGKDGPEAGTFRGVFTIEPNELTTPHSLLVSLYGLHLTFCIELAFAENREALAKLVAYYISYTPERWAEPLGLEYKFDKLGNAIGSMRDDFGLEFLQRAFEGVQQKKMILRPGSPVPSRANYQASSTC